MAKTPAIAPTKTAEGAAAVASTGDSRQPIGDLAANLVAPLIEILGLDGQTYLEAGPAAAFEAVEISLGI